MSLGSAGEQKKLPPFRGEEKRGERNGPTK